ncbi:MAG: helix-turn-helix domain-containing protein [bacterium]|nr:helix-turn-helix domain-containing protein [bacterium]
MDATEDRYLSLKELSRYSGLSVSSLKRRLREPDGIPHFKTGHRVLVKKSEFDLWIERNCRPKVDPGPERVAQLTADIMRSIAHYQNAA